MIYNIAWFALVNAPLLHPLQLSVSYRPSHVRGGFALGNLLSVHEYIYTHCKFSGLSSRASCVLRTAHFRHSCTQ